MLFCNAGCNYPVQAFAMLVLCLAGRTLTVEYVARDPDGRAMEERNAPQNRAGRQGRQHSPPPRRRSRSPDYGPRRNGRDRSVTPPRRYRRSPSPVHHKSDRSAARKHSDSPAPRGRSASLSAGPSMSPKHTGSRSPSTVPYQDANSRAPSKSTSRSPRARSISPVPSG